MVVRIIVALLALSAAAQAAARPAMSGDDEGRPQGSVTDAYVAPPPEESAAPDTRIIQLRNGYLSYQASESEESMASEAKGWVTVVPAPPVMADTRELEPPAEPWAQEPTPIAPTGMTGALDGCVPQAELLSQRLLELRGIEVDPGSALIVQQQLDQAWSPYLALSIFGRPLPLIGDSFLANVSSWDSVTRELTADLAACLNL